MGHLVMGRFKCELFNVLGEEAGFVQVGEDPLYPPRGLGVRLLATTQAGVLPNTCTASWHRHRYGVTRNFASYARN